MSRAPLLKATAAALLIGGSFLAGQALAQATIVVNNINQPGIGFNDPTPVAPVGGNPGTTLGEQRLFATQHAANIWAATLSSEAVIRIRAQFTAQACTETSAVLGSAGSLASYRNFPGATFPDTWYASALRNKLAGNEAVPGADQLQINFNANLGTPGCLSASPWYLGIDNNPPPAAINLVVVLLHEFGHGLGFAVSPTNASTGGRSSGSPSIWERFMFDNTIGKLWLDMTNAERAASSRSVDQLVWGGPNVVAEAPNVLRAGIATATFSGPAVVGGPRTVNVGEASFGVPITAEPYTGELMPVMDQPDGVTGLACEPLSPQNAAAVQGRIALVDRGVCNFIVKTANLQAAGAIGMIVADNVASLLPPNVGGVNPGITFPSASIRRVEAEQLKEELKRRSRTSSGVFVTLGLTGTQLAGADPAGRVKLFAPNPFQGGSSVSHWDVTAFRHQLMEPAINGDLTQSVLPPEDLTFMLFKDIGW